MDPNQLLRDIITHVEGINMPGVWSGMSDEEKADAREDYSAMAADLADWLAKGGFAPDPAPLIERGKRMAGHFGGGSIFDNGRFGTRRYVFYAPLPYDTDDPAWRSWRLVVYDGRDQKIAEYMLS